LARAHADLGQFDDAWSCIGEALTAVETTKERWFEAEINRIAGEIALKSPQSDAAKAEAYFDRALAVARQQQAKSWELRAAMSMARLWRDQGKREEAPGTAWDKSDQGEPMRDACAIAKITPRISFHILRHSWATLAVMNGMPLMVVAKNLGHRDTRMVELHYAHLAPSFIADAIRAHAPVFTTVTDDGVVPLKRTGT
jgi:hypothetical protein